ncbi:MAG: ComEC family competence protein [Lewinellaceae bacterium]|nr:ComEC family competence protein [Lewinellaceae bacterium]
MHPRKTPFLRLFFPWLAGIAVGAWVGHVVPGLGYVLAAGACLLLFLVRQRYHYRFRWVFGGLVFTLLFCAGYRHVIRYDERRQPDHFERTCPEVVVFTGIVYDTPSRGARTKVPLRLESAGLAADSLRACTGNVLLFLDPTPEAERLRYGDRLWVSAAIRPTEPPGNPHAFDYRRYLHFQNIHHQAFVREGAFGVVGAGYGHPLGRLASRWRIQLLGVLHEHFPGRDEYAVASALLLGYKGDLSEELRTTYTETGSMHALAVSGTHVGLMYAALMFVIGRIPWRGKYRLWGQTTLVLLGIWAFTLVTGATASVMRASVMFTCYLLSKAIRRQSSVWNILGASAFGLLLYNPYFLFDAGFQLSYVAVVGIVAFYPMFQKMTPPLPRWAKEGWSILLIGIAAQLGTLPLSLYYFHQFPVYFWLAGWVVVLGGAVFMWGGTVLILLHAVASAPAEWLGRALYYLLWGMNRVMEGIQHLPGSVISGIWITAWAASVLYLCIGLSAAAIVQRHPRLLLAALALLALLGFSRFGQKYTWEQQHTVVLYQANRHFLLDFYDGRRRVTWADSISDRRERFAAQTNRWACGIRTATHLLPASDTVFRAANLLVQPPFVQFFQKKMVVLEHRNQLAPPGTPPIQVDVLILRNNANVRLAECLHQFPAPLVVFDASNGIGRVERWKAECREMKQAFHNVREQGAWVLE